MQPEGEQSTCNAKHWRYLSSPQQTFIPRVHLCTFNLHLCLIVCVLLYKESLYMYIE